MFILLPFKSETCKFIIDDILIKPAYFGISDCYDKFIIVFSTC